MVAGVEHPGWVTVSLSQFVNMKLIKRSTAIFFIINSFYTLDTRAGAEVGMPEVLSKNSIKLK